MAQKEKKTYQLDNQVGYWLRLASQRHTAIFAAALTDGLTPMQFSALMRLAEIKTCSQNKLGRLAGMDVATIKGVVDRLLQKELIQTAPDAHDKRRSIISLTPKGAALVPELHRLGHSITAQTLDALSESETATLLSLLRRIA